MRGGGGGGEAHQSPVSVWDLCWRRCLLACLPACLCRPACHPRELEVRHWVNRPDCGDGKRRRRRRRRRRVANGMTWQQRSDDAKRRKSEASQRIWRCQGRERERGRFCKGEERRGEVRDWEGQWTYCTYVLVLQVGRALWNNGRLGGAVRKDRQNPFFDVEEGGGGLGLCWESAMTTTIRGGRWRNRVHQVTEQFFPFPIGHKFA